MQAILKSTDGRLAQLEHKVARLQAEFHGHLHIETGGALFELCEAASDVLAQFKQHGLYWGLDGDGKDAFKALGEALDAVLEKGVVSK